MYIIQDSSVFPIHALLSGQFTDHEKPLPDPLKGLYIILKNNCPFSSSLNRIKFSSFLATENAKYSYSLRYKETALQMRFPTTYYKHVIGCFKNALVALSCLT